MQEEHSDQHEVLSSLYTSTRWALPVLLMLMLSGTAVCDSLEVQVLLSDIPATDRHGYVCTSLQLPSKQYKLVGVEAMQQESADQMLLYGCATPYVTSDQKKQRTWDCRAQPVCDGTFETILYSWGRDAPTMQFQKGVGFSVGRGSPAAWVVMAVHYSEAATGAEVAGLKLRLETQPMPYSVGMLSYHTVARVPPKKRRHTVWNRCCYRGFQPLRSFAVRVHTRELGRIGVLRKKLSDGVHVLAAGNPQQSQAFRTITGQVIWPGDVLAAACEYDSSNRTEEATDVCDIDLMVHSALPHFGSCTEQNVVVEEGTPGDMTRAAELLPDPFPLWKPPQQDTILNQSVLGEVASVAVGPDGTLWALFRGGRTWGSHAFDDDKKYLFHDAIPGDVVVQMHPDTGKVLRHWGAGMLHLPHMITVDKNSSVYIADAGLHQVLKFSASGQLLLTAGLFDQPGHRLVAAPPYGMLDQPGRMTVKLCQPTDVAVLNDGSFLVADGHCNSRIVRLHANGSYHRQYQLPDKRGTHDISGQPAGAGIAVAHSLVVDECDGEVLLADKENNRVHVFDINTQQLKSTMSLARFGEVVALAKGPYGRNLALTWQPGSAAVLVDVNQPSFKWELPSSEALKPHDFALGPAAMQLSGAGDRLLAVYIAPQCPGCVLQKYVLFPDNFQVPDNVELQQAAAERPQQSTSVEAATLEVGNGIGASSTATAASQEQVDLEQAKGDAEELQQVADPVLMQQLRQALQHMQQQLRQQNKLALRETNEFITVRSGGVSIHDHAALAVVAVVLAFSAVMGAVVGAVAMHALAKRALGPSPSQDCVHGRVEQERSDGDIAGGVHVGCK